MVGNGESVFVLSMGNRMPFVYGVYAAHKDAESELLSMMERRVETNTLRERDEEVPELDLIDRDWPRVGTVFENPIIREFLVGGSEVIRTWVYDIYGKATYHESARS